MPATIIDGTKIAAEIRAEVAERAARLRERGVVPTLNVFLVGDRPDSAVYVRNKERAAQEPASPWYAPYPKRQAAICSTSSDSRTKTPLCMAFSSRRRYLRT
jgi:hypothetical protein